MAAFPQGNVAGSWGYATPLLLGTICRAWRELARSMPRLWCTIHVEMECPDRYRVAKASLLQEWLLRSGRLPLSIRLRLTEPDDSIPNEEVVMWRIMDLIARCSQRWQHVHLDIAYFFHQDKCFFPNGFSQLRSLSMPNPGFGFPANFTMLQHAPMLSDVSLKGYETTLLPPNTLLRLTVQLTSSDECLALLKYHPNLVQGAFKDVSSTLVGPVEIIVEALSLESLEIKFMGFGSHTIAPLLDNLSLPSLHELTLFDLGDEPLYNSLISLILRSSCPLVRFDLWTDLSESQSVECLVILPSLRELKLGGRTGLGAPLIHELTLDRDEDPSSSSVLLPNLTSLSLDLGCRCMPLPFDFADLERMVKSRRQLDVPETTGCGSNSQPNQVARLEAITVRVEIYDYRQVLASDWAAFNRFQALRTEGIRVMLDISQSD